VAADDRAIVVGISHYPLLSDLAGPENDARAFIEWLTSPTEGDVPEDNVCKILSSTFPEETDPRRAQPTAEALKDAIDDLHDLGTKNKLRAGRRLYIFMAGHGIAPKLETAALLMANAARGRTGHHIQGRPYANWFRQAAFFDEVVLFMDCCRDNSRLTPLQRCHLDKVTAKKPASYYYGLATEFNHAARERPGEDNMVRGIFTTALLVGLRQGPPRGGDVTGSWLEKFIFNYMRTLVGEEEECQEPKFYYDRNHDIVFLARDAPIFHVRIRADPTGLSRKVAMIDGSLEEVLPSAHSGGIWQWELKPGFYRYGYLGGPSKPLELIGEGREIDEQL
jgi:Caspase domain